MKEFERSATERVNQDRAKLVYLRQKLMEGDEKMEKMKRSIDVLTKECARKDSEAFSRRERQASPYDYAPECGDSVWDRDDQPGVTTHSAAGRASQHDKANYELPRGPIPDHNPVIVIGDQSVNKPQRPTAGTNPASTNVRASKPSGPPRNSTQAARPKPPPTGGKPASGHAGATSLAKAGTMKEVPRQNADQPSSTSNMPMTVDQSSWADDCITDIELAAIAIGPPTQTRGAPSASNVNRPTTSVQSTMQLRMQQKDAKGYTTGKPTSTSVNPQNGRDTVEKRCTDEAVRAIPEPSQPDSYADAAYKNQFKEPPRRKKRKTRKSSSDSELPDLSGFEDAPNREIFVKDLAYGKCKKPSDLERMVKKHCGLRGVDILFAKTYLMRFSRDKANCRVKVKECDVDTVLNDDFWPRCVTARLWLSNLDFNAGKDDKSSEGELFSD